MLNRNTIFPFINSHTMQSEAVVISLLIFVLLLPQNIWSQDSKAREREIAKYWKSELRSSKSIDHKKVADQNNYIGWLSGLWCKKGEKDAYISYEVKGLDNIKVVTEGYTAQAHKVVFQPESFLYSEAKFFDKPIMIENESFYDLWYYPVGTGASKTRWFYLERIYKTSENSFEIVYRTSFTIRDPSVKFEEFLKEESPKVASTKHWKSPKLFVKCN